MKSWVAIIALADDGYLAKYAEYDEEAQVGQHIARVKEKFPQAFYARNPGAEPIDLRYANGSLVIEPRMAVYEKFPTTQELMSTIEKLQKRLDDLERK